MSKNEIRILELRIVNKGEVPKNSFMTCLMIWYAFRSYALEILKEYTTMKTVNNYLKTTVKSLFVIALATMVACTNNSSMEELEDDFREQKENVIAELEKMKTSINDAIDDVEDKLNINEGPVERSLEEVKADLESKKEDVEDALESAKGATKENWGNVKAEANKALDDIEQGLNKVKKDIEEALNQITD
ncbi:hypothetical protein [Ekhidna sp.]|uniref:hypothetical protein n=1 Tax=Ekhidna sp. TaxID=2608089 RepID=UPI0032996219